MSDTVSSGVRGNDTPDMEFSGRRVAVTGAGKGIGRTIALRLAARGAEVVAISRALEDLTSLAEQTGCATIVADLANDGDLVRVADELGDVDLLVNNAGISIPQPFLDTTLAAFDATMAVNVRAAMFLAQHVARGLVRRGVPGAIVNLSSQASMIALADHTSYCASKGALDQLTRVMALELGPHGIRANAVNPTITMTPMAEMAWADPGKRRAMLSRIPLGRFADPDDVADVVLFLLSERASMITGVTLPVDGGFLVT